MDTDRNNDNIMTTRTLHQNEWVSLMEVTLPGNYPYIYSHETRCQGRIVALLPWRYLDRMTNERGYEKQYLVKSEMTPCWKPERVLSAITGGYEGGDIEDDAVKEMLEETGYSITREDLIPLGTSYASKSADTIYSLFTVDLTGQIPGEANGDGMEEIQQSQWVDEETLKTIMDPQVSVMYLRMNI